MTELKLTLPWPPSVNNYKHVGALIKTKSGKLYQRRVNTPETTGFYYQCYRLAKKAMTLEWSPYATSKEFTFEVSIALYPPDNRRRDIDNVLKVLLDGLVHAHVMKDDSQIERLIVQKMGCIPLGQVIVDILPLCSEPKES